MSQYQHRWRLDGYKAVVTGGSRGIGLATAASLLERGCQVLLVARQDDALQAAKQQLAKEYSVERIECLSQDLSTPKGVRQVADWLQTNWGQLDILINNVGTNVRKAAQDYSEDEYQFILQTNMHSAFRLCKSLYPLLKQSGKASVVNVSSVAGLGHLRTGAVYGMSKAAMNQLSRNLAVEWAPDSIRVNALAPWYTETPLAEQVLASEAYRQSVLQRTPMQRIATPQEMADAITFLCMPAAGYITGVCLAVDGGMTANLFDPTF